ncbi:hypothetical protein CONLIGDRAFT_685406 [Coniochaeta ligniaria NRRL 30616]|uniref:Uncharacterized protein n=1 Tax=Coniochaeta ligniaria NRRL 30616 TaxID=1408157 RepID=A0A1J7IAT9_9PEZI|nr:hypothetical protein CONLIGDRAFT_685406 [Coniochaeta ligniaria NRRL 30616]
MLSVLTEPKYGDGNIVETMLVGTKENPSVNVREVPLEALYPTVGPVGQDNHLLEEEVKFTKHLRENGMRNLHPTTHFYQAKHYSAHPSFINFHDLINSHQRDNFHQATTTSSPSFIKQFINFHQFAIFMKQFINFRGLTTVHQAIHHINTHILIR